MPPPNASSPVNFQAKLPDRVDVIIIGAGVIGISTAWFLAKAGVSVLVCEKGRVAGEQSSRNWGWVRQQGRDAAELPIMMESIRLWDGLGTEVGADLGFQRESVVYIAGSDADAAEHEAWLKIAQEHRLDTRLISARELNDLIPDLKGNWKSAMITPSDGRAEPFIAVPAIARATQKAGVTIIENCAARTLETTAGRISGVVTEHGPVRCDKVLLAGGAWSSTFLANFGLDLPQLAVKATVARTRPSDSVYEGNVSSPTLAFRRREDGGYSIAPSDFHEHFVSLDSVRHLRTFWPLIKESWRDTKLRFTGDPMRTPAGRRWRADQVSPFEHVRVLDPKPAPWLVDRLARELAEHLPALKDVGLVEAWSGMIDTTPDVVPVIDEVSNTPGLHIATGFSGHGFGIGPGMGRVVADLLQNKPPGYDLSRFRLSRFSDGTPLDAGPTL